MVSSPPCDRVRKDGDAQRSWLVQFKSQREQINESRRSDWSIDQTRTLKPEAVSDNCGRAAIAAFV